MANLADMITRLNGTTFFHGETKDGYPMGSGEYVFANGTVYRGTFYEGMFDGEGTLEFPSGGRYVATWKLGKLVKGKYFYADNLQYAERNWAYCSDADRRFWTEQQPGATGIALAAPDTASYTDADADDDDADAAAARGGAAGSGVASIGGGGPQLSDRIPPPRLPVGSYDVGDGYYQPSDGKIYTYEGKFLRVSSGAEADWALKKCRVGLASEHDPNTTANLTAAAAAAATAAAPPAALPTGTATTSAPGSTAYAKK